MKYLRCLLLVAIMSLSLYTLAHASVIKQREVLELLLEAGKVERANEIVSSIEDENEKIKNFC